MPHRDEFSACSSCRVALELQGRRWLCPQCRGVLIASADLEQMLNEMSPDDERPLSQRLFKSGHAQRGCPRCGELMAACQLHDIELDRCVEHGVWFDGDELARVLQATGDAYAERQANERPPSSLGGILGSTLRALLSPWLARRKLADDIARTTPGERDKLE